MEEVPEEVLDYSNGQSLKSFGSGRSVDVEVAEEGVAVGVASRETRPNSS